MWCIWGDASVEALHDEFGICGLIGDATMLYSLLWVLETVNGK